MQAFLRRIHSPTTIHLFTMRFCKYTLDILYSKSTSLPSLLPFQPIASNQTTDFIQPRTLSLVQRRLFPATKHAPQIYIQPYPQSYFMTQQRHFYLQPYHSNTNNLTFWPKMAHFHHFSMFKQNQSISILVIFGQNTKAIALLFGQQWLIFITFHCSIKINQFQFWSFLGKIPRL